jgi:hypothetical protein
VFVGKKEEGIVAVDGGGGGGTRTEAADFVVDVEAGDWDEGGCDADVDVDADVDGLGGAGVN